jgi:small subunit ribosomal protein S9
MSTRTPAAVSSERQWHIIDAKDQVLGRIASRAAKILQGKHKASWTPFLDHGDHVVVINAALVRLTGRKEEQKIYRPAQRVRRRAARGTRGSRAAEESDPPRRRGGARHVAEDEAGRRDVSQTQGVREGRPPARRAKTEDARGRITLALSQHYGTGRRKTSTARVFLIPGSGKITVNDRTLESNFPAESLRLVIRQPLVLTETAERFDVRATTKGGGVSGQAGALRLGIARALVESNADFRSVLRRPAS